MTQAEISIPGYRIIEPLGHGGMAVVYRARQLTFDRDVALKILKIDTVDDPSFHKRFLMESRIIASLNHSHIVPVYDVGEVDNHLYIAMEFLPGGDLNDHLNRGSSQQHALIIVKQIASALDFAHSKGVIHRDIKPDNIMFREDGSAVITDFGVAKVLGSELNVTKTGLVVGTPKYMSPEQLKGGKITGAADLYSLGVVFFALLTGRLPYSGKDMISVAYRHIYDPVPRLPSACSQFQRVIDGTMAKLEGDRFPRGLDIVKAIVEVEQQYQRKEGTDNVTVATGKHMKQPVSPFTKGTAKPLKPKPASPLVASALTKAKTVHRKKSNIDQQALTEALRGAPRRHIKTVFYPIFFLLLLGVFGFVTWQQLEKRGGWQHLYAEVVNASQINFLLVSAQEDMNDFRWRVPKDSNAFDKYVQVLKLSRDNASARAGVQNIIDGYLLVTAEAKAQGDTGKAKRYQRLAERAEQDASPYLTP